MWDYKRSLGLVTASLVLWAGANAGRADTATNPYQGIVERNVFDLRPPPPPAAVEAPVAVPAARITLTGITTILGNKRAYLKTQARGQPGQPPADDSCILAEGQREGDLTVLEIDEKAGTVKVNNAGTIATLSFAENGVKGPPPGAGATTPQPASAYANVSRLTPASTMAGGSASPLPVVTSSLTPVRAAVTSSDVNPRVWRRSLLPALPQ
jgi:hypothetical protein